MTAYRLWPSTSGPGAAASDTSAYTMGMQFTVSQPAPLTGIWFWSAPSNAFSLPTACAIYAVSGTSIVAGTLNSSPGWSGALGSGWVKCAYNGSVTLAPSTAYKVVCRGGVDGNFWYSATSHYWDSGAGSGGLSNGPISAPANSGASPGQDSFHAASAVSYPDTSFNAANYWVDVEVTIGAAGGVLLGMFP